MNLSSPLEVITPTLDAVVLQTLAATTGWVTGGELHRRCRSGSRDGVRRVALRLVAQGIVLAQEHANATLFLLNREHVSVDGLIALTRIRPAILDRLTAALQSWTLPPLHASVFGSFARGEAGSDSDVDILVLGPRLTADTASSWLDQIDRLGVDVMRWTGNQPHIVNPDPDVLAQMIATDDPLIRAWRRDNLHLSGADLLDLLGRSA